jgi:hypothetical protein
MPFPRSEKFSRLSKRNSGVYSLLQHQKAPYGPPNENPNRSGHKLLIRKQGWVLDTEMTFSVSIFIKINRVKILTNKSMFYIVISQDKKYYKSANLIKKEYLSTQAIVISIEKLKRISCKKEDIIFFMTIDERIKQFISSSHFKKAKIINKKYITGRQEKSYINKKARAAGVNGPAIAININLKTELDKNQIEPPVYIKSEKHSGGVFRIKNKTEFKKIANSFNLLNNGKWYMEKALDLQGRRVEKIYSVSGLCFRYNGQKPRSGIIKTMNLIKNTFLLDVFSVDFIISKRNHWCIDINHAPGFFKSDFGRKIFVNFIKTMEMNKSTPFNSNFQ